MLCKHHLYLVLTILHHLQETTPSKPSCPSAPNNNQYIFGLYRFAALAISYNYNETICDLLCLVSLSLSFQDSSGLHHVSVLSSFLRLYNIRPLPQLHVRVYTLLKIPLSADGYLGCFHLLVTMNSAAMNIHYRYLNTCSHYILV